MFLSEELKAAYGLPYDTSYTDDASVAAKYGIPLSYIEGERNNIKLTTPWDMTLAEMLI
jgi:2-C-methyl-D-erythritol 4-phosphate cytidylyltransferase